MAELSVRELDRGEQILVLGYLPARFSPVMIMFMAFPVLLLFLLPVSLLC